MPNIRIKDIPTTASATSSTDFIGIDGSANGTRKLDAYNPTFGGNLTVSGTGTIAGVQAYRSSGTTQQLRIGYDNNNYWDLSRDNASTGNLVLRSSNVGAGATALLTFANSTGDATLAGNLTVSGSIVNQNGVIQSTLAAGALISSLSTNNNAVHGFQISGSGTGSRDWRLEQGRAGANSFSISNATGGLTTPLIVNGATNNILIGFSSASSDSGNGKLQLATHTTSAGGIGFGTDTSIWRVSSGILAVNARLRDGTFSSCFIDFTGGQTTVASNSSLTLNSGATTALTLDSSQRTILSGALRLANSYVATPQVSTGYVTIQDSTGTTYKVLVAP